MSDVLESRRATMRALQRRQLLEAFAAAVSRTGFAAATISDIVRAAHVSKTTFYEHFADKEAVYLELHRYAAEQLTAALAASVARSADQPWQERARDVVESYLDRVATDTLVLAQVQIETSVVTPAAREAREAASRAFAEVMVTFSRGLADASREAAELDAGTAYLALAGTTRAVSDAAARGPDDVRALADDVHAFWLRILRAPAARPA